MTNLRQAQLNQQRATAHRTTPHRTAAGIFTTGTHSHTHLHTHCHTLTPQISIPTQLIHLQLAAAGYAQWTETNIVTLINILMQKF